MSVASLFLATAIGQTQPFDWRRIGTVTVSSGLASPAGGSVERVWFGPSGTILYARTAGGVWQTADFEKWTVAPADVQPAGDTSNVSASSSQTGRLFRGDSFAWRSDDAGRSWANLTEFNGRSILGGELVDIAVSPANPDEVVVAGANGVWRSVDAGNSWSGLNENLPNLPVERILEVPQSSDPSARVLLGKVGEALWSPGERGGWRLAKDSVMQREALLKMAVPVPNVTAVVRSGE
ncbi:MAG: hypothetical protein H7039_12825, partial [Bryobacteraceae bacterium]|nr:hypothetical protein [Bryobacteraceae bacterium]